MLKIDQKPSPRVSTLGAVIFVLLIPVQMMFDGFVLKALWGWFVIPVFELPALTFPQAIGLCVLAPFLTHQYNQQTDDGGMEVAWKMMRWNFINPAILLATGFVVHLFM